MLADDRRQRGRPYLVALAEQPDMTGPGGRSDVLCVQTLTLLDLGSGVQQHGDDRPVTDAMAGGGTLNPALLGPGERVRLAGLGHPGPLHRDARPSPGCAAG